MRGGSYERHEQKYCASGRYRAGVVGSGTILNVVTVLAGSAIGIVVGNRLRDDTRVTVTDGLGLITLIVGALNCTAIGDAAFERAGGENWTLLVVLGAVVVGGITGSMLGIERRLNGVGARLERRFASSGTSEGQARFVQGFVSASLLFCVGPLTILGSINDGLGRGIEQLALKSLLDFFASIAFAASLGIGVAFAAITVAVVQGALTMLGVLFGSVMPDSLVSAMTATGGVLLLGIGMRLLALRDVRVADMLPALIVAPVLTYVVDIIR